MSELIIDRGLLNSILSRAKVLLPIEAVTFILGHKEIGRRIAENIINVNNDDDSPFSFSVAPDDLFRVYQEAEQKGADIIGLFHSHPSSTIPSSKDLFYMRLNNYVWIIASSIDWKVSAYILDEKGFATVVTIFINS